MNAKLAQVETASVTAKAAAVEDISSLSRRPSPVTCTRK